MSIEVDKHTKDQASEFANNEADLHGFKVGSDRWKKSFKEYISFAKGTMSIGRNPRMQKNPLASVAKFYPEMFGESGIAGKLAKNYRSPDGAVPITAIQNRILADVTNMVKLFENGILQTSNTTKGRKQGRIDNTDMSSLQLPEKTKGMSDAEYNRLKTAVVRNLVVRDLLTNLMIESITPFFSMDKSDVDQILNSINFNVDSVRNYQWPAKDDPSKKSPRESFIETLHGFMKQKFKDINFRKFILGR